MMPQMPALSTLVVKIREGECSGHTHIMPKLMLLASTIFSRRCIRSDQMNSHGNAAKKKSHALDHTPSPTLIGWICRFQCPAVRNGSQLILTGVDWFHSMMVSAVDVLAVTPTRHHSAILCQRSWTTRSKKRPVVSLAMALPVMANVLAT